MITCNIRIRYAKIDTVKKKFKVKAKWQQLPLAQHDQTGQINGDCYMITASTTDLLTLAGHMNRSYWLPPWSLMVPPVVLSTDSGEYYWKKIYFNLKKYGVCTSKCLNKANAKKNRN